jgi:hypothetical protein
MVRFLCRLFAKKLFQRMRAVFFKERTRWFIASRPRSGSRTVLTDLDQFNVVLPPKGRFYADPSLIKRNGKTHLFFEDFDFSKNRALISCAELKSNGELGVPFPVLEKDYHLSYPFVFELDGTMYMIPETRARNTIELYRAVTFPEKWELVKVLAENIRAVDSTIFQHQGKLWLFANIAEPGASTFDELHLFHSDSLEGNWKPHPKNPVVSDVRRARPAGALFYDGERLIRPSQDCSLHYGRAMTLNHVTLLSETDYQEAPISRIEPGWYSSSICTHTYNRTDEFEVLDGMVIQRPFRFFGS